MKIALNLDEGWRGQEEEKTVVQREHLPDHRGWGRTVASYRKNQKIFSQGDPADAVFYIQEGKVKVLVVSDLGKDAVVA